VQKEWRQETFNAAMGAQKWMNIRIHKSAADSVRMLRSQGYNKILVSDVNPQAKSLDDHHFVTSSSQERSHTSEDRVVFVLGTEKYGVSAHMKSLADGFYYLPMCGFAESFNLSVATALTVSACKHKNLLTPNLSNEEQQRLILMWMCKTISGSAELLAREGLIERTKS
jgi:tRNA (guanosine-2'-O-)-methyltransferase